MQMKLYNGLKNFLEPVIIRKKTITDAIRPVKTFKSYSVEGSVAFIDGTESDFRPGGKISVGDMYLQVTAGGVTATQLAEDNVPTDIKETIKLESGDIILYCGDQYEVFFVRDEVNIIDIADVYGRKLEVANC